MVSPSPETQLPCEERSSSNGGLVPLCLLSPSMQSDDSHGKKNLDKVSPQCYLPVPPAPLPWSHLTLLYTSEAFS